jgi:hypothetical protein
MARSIQSRSLTRLWGAKAATDFAIWILCRQKTPSRHHILKNPSNDPMCAQSHKNIPNDSRPNRDWMTPKTSISNTLNGHPKYTKPSSMDEYSGIR